MAQAKKFFRSLKKQTLAEQIADTVQEAIVRGEWAAGSQLPTEPELGEQFGVSRAVIRDATRLLVARGLVEAQHGKGVFVTESNVAAFGAALLLALRRAKATAWDVEHFEQMIYPEVLAEAAAMVTDEELAEIELLKEQLMAVFEQVTQTQMMSEEGSAIYRTGQQKIMAAYRQFMQAIFKATHNAVFILLAEPLLQLRSLRHWEGVFETLDDTVASERQYLEMIVAVVATRDREQARMKGRTLFELPAEAEAAMKETPIGEVTRIVMKG
ncbi:MAG TPA: GntR family transcriptional regulator [Anaerolineae bacterium]|nr:GntR family transcriptional regulator [Anaerolineae bacterium]